MAEHIVTNASLNRKELVFQNGTWYRRGRFKINHLITGKFDFHFINGHQGECFAQNLFLPSYKNIRQDTFTKKEDIFKEQIIEIVKPTIQEEIERIKELESTIELPPLTINKVGQVNSQYFIVYFQFEGEDQKRMQITKKNEDSDWIFEAEIRNSVSFKNIQSSLWFKTVCEAAIEHENLKVALLF